MKDKITLEWINKANSDLAFAQASLREFDDFYSQMCILCHDAVEKYLKAYITSCGVKPERIHDLVTLLNECIKISEVPEKFETHKEECRVLNRYYTPLKYPSHYPIATKEQATEAIEIATDMDKFIKECLEECG
ncbi:HEPN domain-containing protein [bacterium]|nr:HEPN domain-containing protein [bacterium]MBU1152420.1 HEPN domain-containing protein [bacterium]MBU2600487.1 HEPN domain-containing protein [bacterium]